MTRPLKKNEILLVIFLGLVIIGAIYYRGFYCPQTLEFQKTKNSFESAKIKKISLESQMPHMISLERAFKDRKKLYKIRLDKIEEEEKKILAPSEITVLLESIAKSGMDLDVEIVYIKSKEPSKKRTSESVYYADYLIDLHYISSFANSVQYISRLEEISDYLKVEDVKMEIEKQGESQPHTYVLLSTIINEKASRTPQGLLKEIMSKPEEIKIEDPFSTQAKPYNKELPVKLTLSAILWGEKNQAAVIDGQIKRVGDMIGKLEVKDILPDKVILRDGNKFYELIRKKRGE